MTLLGIVLLILGLVFGLHVLLWVGLLLVVCGFVFLGLHFAGHGRYWY